VWNSDTSVVHHLCMKWLVLVACVPGLSWERKNQKS
jgi:hypothetical protein